MSNVQIPPTPYQSAVVDQNNMITDTWSKWLYQLYRRAGGASAPSNDQLFVSPMQNIGDTIYGIASGAPANLPANISATNKFLTELGSGTAGNPPAWNTIQVGDVPTLNQNTTGTAGSISGTNTVVNTNLAKMPTNTIKGNNTAGSASPLDLTLAQLNAILPVFTSLLNGLVPLSGGGTTNFLRSDGTWAAAGGGGQEFHYGSDCTTISSAITATSFTTFSNSPTLTFTPTLGGTWKVYSSAAYYTPSGLPDNSRIFNSSGSATLIKENAATFDSQVYSNSLTFSIYTLVGGTAYSFDLQGLAYLGGGGSIYLRGDNAPFSIIAERMGA